MTYTATNVDVGYSKGFVAYASESDYDNDPTKNNQELALIPIELEETPMSVVTQATTASVESGKAYYMHIGSSGCTFSLPTIASANRNVYHSLTVMFDTYASTVVKFQSSAGVYLDPAGVQSIEASKHYTANVVYRPYWDATLATPAMAWKWVLYIREDVITTSS